MTAQYQGARRSLSAHTPMMQQYLTSRPRTRRSCCSTGWATSTSCFMTMPAKASQLLDISPDQARPVGRQSPSPWPGCYHAIEGYLAKLVQLGESAAICERVGSRHQQGAGGAQGHSHHHPGHRLRRGAAQRAAGQPDRRRLPRWPPLRLRHPGYRLRPLLHQPVRERRALLAELQRTNPAELLYPESFAFLHHVEGRRGLRRRPEWEFELGTARKLSASSSAPRIWWALASNRARPPCAPPAA